MSRALPTALFVAYPLLVHAGVLLAQPLLRWVGLLALFAGIFLAPLRAGRPAAWLGYAAFAAATWVVGHWGEGAYALYLAPPALIGLALAGFLRSLRPGTTPLVTAIAERVHGPLSPALQAHTRAVTRLWAGFLASLLAVTLLLTFFAPLAWWSLFTNLISYLLMGALFLGEFLYRRWRFPDHDRTGFFGYLRQLARQGGARGGA